MLSIYPAIFYGEKDGGYSVVFPDLNHLATFGTNFENAMSMAIDCLAGYIYSANKELPTPTPLNKIDIHCEDDLEDSYISAFATMVSVDVDEYAKLHFNKSVKKTLTIPMWLDKRAKEKKINFSKTLQEALMAKLS